MLKKKNSLFGVRASIKNKIVSCLGGLALMAFGAMPVSANTVFINELHYDNSGADMDEGVEIAAREQKPRQPRGLGRLDIGGAVADDEAALVAHRPVRGRRGHGLAAASAEHPHPG